MITLTNVTYRYPFARRAAVVGLTQTIPPGRSVLLGPNGAGKSTLIKLAAGLLAPQQGSIAYAGYGTVTARATGRLVGYLPQGVKAVAGLSVGEQVSYSAWLKGHSTRDARRLAGLAMDRVGIADLAGRSSRSLSGGQLRRLGLAEALVTEPAVLLLDEPTAGLDPEQRERFGELLRTSAFAQAVAISTHQVDDYFDQYDHVLVVAQGSIRYAGGPAGFLQLGVGDTLTRTLADAYSRVVGGAGL